MRKLGLKSRIFGLLGSTGLAAGMVAPSACGGTSVAQGEAGDAGESGDGGSLTTGAGGSANPATGGGKQTGAGGGEQPGSGAQGGAFPGHGGSATAGVTSISGSPNASGGFGNGGFGNGGFGNGGFGNGGFGNGGFGNGGFGNGGFGNGGFGNGGTSAAEGGDGGSLPANCFNPGPGVCCSSASCLSVQEAWRLVGAGGAPDLGSGGFAGAENEASGAGGVDVPLPPGCPSGNDLPRGLCFYYQGEPELMNGQCCYEYTSGSCCGRPFLVAGKARLPSVASRTDWFADTSSHACELDCATRTALSEEWLADARLEHASIASFSRFVLELLSVSAPAALVELAQQALADEIAHTRLCFGLASKFAERPMGPGALDIAGSVVASSLAEVAARAVIEGCVGETLAALQAEAQLVHATDSDARHALETIRWDEATHAELAWSFVRWALQQGDESVFAAVRLAFASAERALRSERPAPAPCVDELTLHAHGRLTPAERLRCHLAAFDDVIAPCRAVLLERESGEFEANGTVVAA
jgi:hypothetical protein